MNRRNVSVPLAGVRVFTSSVALSRLNLGERVTEWIAQEPEIAIKDVSIVQSSDSAFHCVTIVVFYGRYAP